MLVKRFDQNRENLTYHASGRDGVNTGAEVLDNGTSATLDGENTSNLQDDV